MSFKVGFSRCVIKDIGVLGNGCIDCVSNEDAFCFMYLPNCSDWNL